MTSRAELSALRDARRRPILTAAFWVDTFERVVASAAGGALAVFPLEGLGLLRGDTWLAVGVAAAGAGAVSLLKALAASGTGTGSASLAPRV